MENNPDFSYSLSQYCMFMFIFMFKYSYSHFWPFSIQSYYLHFALFSICKMI